MKENKILVVSDNPDLVSFFQKECVNQGVSDSYNVDYHYSASNKEPAEMLRLGATPINVKNEGFIKFALKEYCIIFSLHCKQIFPRNLVESIMCINVHPGFNPYNRGWYPQVFSIINGMPVGATIHLMDKEVDHGKIIDQVKVNVRPYDTSLEVYERVIHAEKKLISDNLLKILGGRISTFKPDSEGNYNSIDDFNALCELNLENKATLREHIDLLRALSHGDFKNAYFFDEKGKKVFISVLLED